MVVKSQIWLLRKMWIIFDKARLGIAVKGKYTALYGLESIQVTHHALVTLDHPNATVHPKPHRYESRGVWLVCHPECLT